MIAKFQPHGGYFDIEDIRKESVRLDLEMQNPAFWQNQDRARAVSQKAEHLKSVITDWDNLSKNVADNLSLANEILKKTDPDLEVVLAGDLEKLTRQFEKLESLVLFSGKYDSANALVSLHAGAGGTEAQDWVNMLLKMYLTYCSKKNFTVKIVDQSKGQEAGYKSIALEIIGPYAYGNLKSEAGVHRLVRISPFDAEKMRHTSFALVEVLPELEESINEINEADLKIDTMRSGGAGGQSVNTTDSAVRITHIPTGLVVKCQSERSQLQNRKIALKFLQAKLEKLSEVVKGKELSEIRGDLMSAEWGSQIRSYVLQPYKLVKDHRTDFELTDPEGVLGGELDELIENYLRYVSKASK